MQTGRRPARAVQGRAMLRSVSMQQKQTFQAAAHEAGVIFKTAVSYALNGSRDWAGGMDGAEKVVYTETRQAQADKVRSQVSLSLQLCWVWRQQPMHGGGMSQVAGQRPINRRPGKLSLWRAGTRPAHSAPTLGEWILDLLAIFFIQ